MIKVDCLHTSQVAASEILNIKRSSLANLITYRDDHDHYKVVIDEKDICTSCTSLTFCLICPHTLRHKKFLAKLNKQEDDQKLMFTLDIHGYTTEVKFLDLSVRITELISYLMMFPMHLGIYICY